MRWAVPDILPEGLTLLAGKPKQGKSWLALSVALSIAAGGVALGAQPVTQGDVLYLALEDNARRLQARAKQLLASMTDVPGGMEFALEWPRLVVIDTWAKVAPPSGERRCSQYAGDYEALTPLKRLADTYHVSILAVHHLRKTGSSDVLDEITGSTGMTGAVDGALILKRERGQMEATLFVTGRDVEHEQHLALSFDATTAQWTLVGNAEEVGRTRARQEILDLLREQQPDGMSPRAIAEALEKNYHTIRSILVMVTGENRLGSTSRNRLSTSNRCVVILLAVIALMTITALLRVMTLITLITVITLLTAMTSLLIHSWDKVISMKRWLPRREGSRLLFARMQQWCNKSVINKKLPSSA